MKTFNTLIAVEHLESGSVFLFMNASKAAEWIRNLEGKNYSLQSTVSQIINGKKKQLTNFVIRQAHDHEMPHNFIK